MKNPLTAWEAVLVLIKEAIQTIRDQDRSSLIKSRKLGENYKYFKSLKNITSHSGIQARMPFELDVH